jgi:hypothetical protein
LPLSWSRRRKATGICSRIHGLLKFRRGYHKDEAITTEKNSGRGLEDPKPLESQAGRQVSKSEVFVPVARRLASLTTVSSDKRLCKAESAFSCRSLRVSAAA